MVMHTLSKNGAIESQSSYPRNNPLNWFSLFKSVFYYIWAINQHILQYIVVNDKFIFF